MKTPPRVIFIVGPTSSGKTALGLTLAKKFNGEIINADARQIYRGVNIGTGKPVGKRQVVHGHYAYVVDGIPHHVMDDVPPGKTFTVADWRKKALKAIRDISGRGRLPIVVGGTGLYVQTLLDNYKIPSVPPQPAFREAIASKSLEGLVNMLKRMDPEAAKTIDLKNPRRVIRALEVITFTGKPFSEQRLRAKPAVDPLVIGPSRSREELYERIDAAVDDMVKRGWVQEIRRLLGRGVPEDAPAMSSIGYRELAAFVRGACSLEEAVKRAKHATHQYAKRQMTWFKRDERIHWVKDGSEAERLVRAWVM